MAVWDKGVYPLTLACPRPIWLSVMMGLCVLHTLPRVSSGVQRMGSKVTGAETGQFRRIYLARNWGGEAPKCWASVARCLHLPKTEGIGCLTLSYPDSSLQVLGESGRLGSFQGGSKRGMRVSWARFCRICRPRMINASPFLLGCACLSGLVHQRGHQE